MSDEQGRMYLLRPLPDGQADTNGQPFPEGAKTKQGKCDGLCGRETLVVPARIGPSWRTALSFDYCAECLADFIAGAPVMGGHVYALASDDLYHECVMGALE